MNRIQVFKNRFGRFDVVLCGVDSDGDNFEDPLRCDLPERLALEVAHSEAQHRGIPVDLDLVRAHLGCWHSGNCDCGCEEVWRDVGGEG